MKSILICPSDRPEVGLLAEEASLAAAPALGQGVLEYWMSHLAGAGVKEVAVLASDRPEEIRKIVGNGSRWGLAAEVFVESRELSAEQASEKHGGTAVVMDHFPGFPENPLFDSYATWFKAVAAWMPRAKTPDRAGVREVRDGVWAGRHTHISRAAQLCAPCWVGDHVYIGPGAVIGPQTVLEDGAFVEREAEIRNSVIGTATFVGRYVQIINSLAWGNRLVNWQTGAEHTVTDAFLLCSVRLNLPSANPMSLMDRVAGWLAPAKETQRAPATVQAVDYEALLLKKG